MRFLKILFIFSFLIFLNGCLQSTALLGPGVTIATTGNVVQAGFQYGLNKKIKNETGKDAIIFVKEVVEKDHKKKRFNRDFKKIVENRVFKARQKMSTN